ncbi:tetratricopeptide repeat protein [bacterium]|nr:MAG: tetratricopeptide repeat protein [bacterium]
MSRNFQNILLVCLLAVFSFVLYFNSLGNAFVFDDQHTILDNAFIKNFSSLPLFFKGAYTSVPDVPRGMFRPLLLVTFSFNYFFSGIQPLGYHIINIIIHFLNGVLLYLLLRFLKNSLPFGLILFFCLLFIAHPINTEAVTYISCRSDLLVTFFIAAAFIFYAKGRKAVSLFLYICALMTKETALVFGFLAFAYDFIYSRQAESKKKMFIFYLAIIGITASYWIYRGAIFHFGATELFLPAAKSTLRGFWPNIFIQSVISIFYLRLFFWPHPLNLHHEIPDYVSLFHPAVFSAVFAISVMAVLIFVLKKKYPLASFGLAWYFICLIPKFYAPLSFPSMEHHSYLPGLGLYFILGQICEEFYLKSRRRFIYLASVFIGVFTLLTWSRNAEWKDGLSLYTASVRDNPSSSVAYNNLGIQYANMGLSEEAEKAFKKALVLTSSVDVHINCRLNLAKIYLNRKRFKEAMDELDRALIIKPSYSEIYQSYGAIYSQMGQKEKSEELWKKGLSFNPRAVGILDNMGMFCLEKGRLEEAELYFRAAIKYNPDDANAYFGLGQIFEHRLNNAQAIKAYEKSVFLNPAYGFLHYCLGTLYAKKADKRAFWHLKEAIRLSPDLAEAYNNIAIFYASMVPPKIDLAVQHAKKALSLGYSVDKEFLKLLGLPESLKE